MKPLSSLIDSYSLVNQSFADDTQLLTSTPANQVHSSIQLIQTCVSDIKDWMIQNKLQLNDEKTEVLLLKSKSTSLPDPEPKSIQVGSCDVQFAASARNLGFTLSSDMTLDKHISNVCRSAYIEIRRISSIRHLLTTEAAKTLLCSLICAVQT